MHGGRKGQDEIMELVTAQFHWDIHYMEGLIGNKAGMVMRRDEVTGGYSGDGGDDTPRKRSGQGVTGTQKNCTVLDNRSRMIVGDNEIKSMTTFWLD